MTSSIDQIEEYIERLEGDADEIVAKIDNLYSNIEMGYESTQGDSFTPGRRSNRRQIWTGPKGETKELQDELREEYESWYARAEELVSTHLPQRLEEFERRRTTVKEYIRVNKNAKHDRDTYVENAADKFAEQRNVVKAIPGKVRAERLSLRRQVSETVSKGELQKARKLLEEDLPRAAGVLAGVALEQHLQIECDEADLEYNYDDGITTLAQTLYEEGEITKTTLSNMETLGQIRNDCAHANQQEPHHRRVQSLIDDTDDYIRGRGI